MASTKTTNTKSRASAKDLGAPQKPALLIPKHKRYMYKPATMNAFVQDIVKSSRTKRVKIDVPTTQHGTIKPVHALCSAANANLWSPEYEKALVETLPVREHHKAFLSCNLFVTMISTVVVRALEQATRPYEETLDLLVDRHYVRSIVCHDSSKTSATEAAYAGIMAFTY